MSRQIKFRVYDAYLNKMHEHDSIYNNSVIAAYIMGKNERDREHCEKYYSPPMQFTGLQDKAGRDIYEGDICRRGHLIGTVVYHKERAMFILKDTYGFNTALYEDGVLLEVIGNIYEHPELLTHVSPQS